LLPVYRLWQRLDFFALAFNVGSSGDRNFVFGALLTS
jgi:hypothetical protein